MLIKTAIRVGPVPPSLVLYGSGLGWNWIGSLRQSSEVGPGYLFYLGGRVGFDEGGRWEVSLFTSTLLRPGVFSLQILVVLWGLTEVVAG